MQRYQVNHRYSSHCDGRDYGPYEPGTTVELSPEDAEWINRSSPGTLTLVDDMAAETGEPADADVDGDAEPVKDRAHRGGRKRAG